MDDGPNVIIQNDGGNVRAKNVPLAPPMPEEDVHKAYKEQVEKDIVAKNAKKAKNKPTNSFSFSFF